jgi:tetratricopeptide (TPR) repeat protein
MQFQWVMPIGSLTAPISLEDTVNLIRSGRVFPPQLVSIDGASPLPAAQQTVLQQVWSDVTPPIIPFNGQMGRVNILTLGKLFAYFSLERMNGRLFIRHSESGLHFTLRFVSGQLLEVSALDPSTYLGQLLLQRQLITPSQLVQVIEYARAHHKPIGIAGKEQGLISEKTLNQLLAEQMFIRIRKISCFPHLDIRFCEDQNVAMIPPVARISGYSLLEITLGYGLSDKQIKSYIGDLLLRPIRVNRKSPALKMISAEDRSVLKRVDASGSLDPLKERGEWTQRDSALKAISWDLISLFEIPLSFALSQEYVKLSEGDPLAHLKISPLAQPHEIEKAVKEYRHQIQLDAPSETADEEHIKRAIKAKIIEIMRSLEGSERERRAYQRMKQMGADLKNQELYRSVLFDICVQEGEASLKRQRYQEASEAYKEALTLRPNDLNTSLQEVWSLFLGNPRDEQIFNRSKKRLIDLVMQMPSSPLPPLFLARIHRLYGDLTTAEQYLRKVLEISPNHTEAQAELRLLFNRDFDKKKRKVRALTQLNPDANKWLLVTGVSLLLTAVFWSLGNFITHPREIWPEERQLDVSSLDGLNPFKRQLTFNSILRTNYSHDSLASTAYRLGLKPHKLAEPQMSPGEERPVGYKVGRLEADLMREITRDLNYLYQSFSEKPDLVMSTLRSSLVIPAHLRVLGNVEHYWLQEDMFGWARRLVLILIGLFGLYRIRPLQVTWAPVVGMSFLALIYGSLIGYLSPAFSSPTSVPTLTGMKIAHSLGEVIFFQFFIGISLLRGFNWTPYLPTLGVVVLMGIFKLSYLNVWYMEFDMMLLSILQIGLFIGGGCFLFMWKTKSFIPPIIAHLALTLIPMIRGIS